MLTQITLIGKRSKQIEHGTTTNDTRRDVTFNGKYSPLASQCWRISYLLGDANPRYPLPVPINEMIGWCEWIEDEGLFVDFMHGVLDMF